MFGKKKVYFEFRQKQREQSLPEKQLQKQNTPKIQRQFADYIIQKQYHKMKLLASKGFDPNFIMENGGFLNFFLKFKLISFNFIQFSYYFF